MKEKLLIISYSFPPDNVPAAQRPYFMAKYLSEKTQLETIVLTTENSLSSLGKSKWANLDNLRIVYTNSNNKSGVDQSANRTLLNKKSKPFNKFLQSLSRELLIPDKAIHWLFKATRAARKILKEEPDIKYIYSTSPSFVNHLVANRIKDKAGVKWIADFRDFYYLNNIADANFFFRKFIDKRLEKSILQNADILNFTTRHMFNEYLKRYPFLEKKSELVFNGFDEGEFDFKEITVNRTSNKLIIFYAGSFYKGVRSPAPLLNALERLLELKRLSVEDIEIRIAGNIPGEIFEEFKGYKIYPSIVLLGIMPRKQALEEMMNAHFLWLIIGSEKAHYLSFPVKGYEYIAARRYILNFAPSYSEAARIISELQCGTTFGIEAADYEENANKLSELFDMFKAGAFDKPISIDNDLLQKYTRQYQANQVFKSFHMLNGQP
jgi:glycosyltransferase involved in cell wall biosynthesis